MKMNLGNVEVRVELRKRNHTKLSAAERAFKNERALKHYEKNKERVNTDYFFGA
ncbi:hypothetical protein [Fusibacter sp. JL216-2]|uniref:hypothetical protein n=1 Tax=Fusibacter sp. JL216-2 TaxID=3071453 RepID=UPI003D32EC64